MYIYTDPYTCIYIYPHPALSPSPSFSLPLRSSPPKRFSVAHNFADFPKVDTLVQIRHL